MESTAPVASEQLPETLRGPIGRYAKDLQNIRGLSVLGLTVYGAAVSGTIDPQRHSVSSVVVLRAIDLDGLRQLAAAGGRFGRHNIAAPLIMTPEYIRASRDTFPLELLEIQQQHLTVFGQDYFSDLNFEEAHVRLQCERELKALLIGMHQGLLAAGGHEGLLGALGTDRADSLLRVLRGLLWLNGVRHPQPAFGVIGSVEKLLGRPLAGIYAALDTSNTAGWDKFQKMYADIQALGQFADAF